MIICSLLVDIYVFMYLLVFNWNFIIHLKLISENYKLSTMGLLSDMGPLLSFE